MNDILNSFRIQCRDVVWFDYIFYGKTQWCLGLCVSKGREWKERSWIIGYQTVLYYTY